MTHTSPPFLKKILSYLKPRRISWVLSNIVLSLIVLSAIEEVTVKSGQAGAIDVFVWPAYWGHYYLTDTPIFATPIFSWTALIQNYLYGVVPLFVAINVGVNAVPIERVKNWNPSLSRFSWAVIVFFLLITYVPFFVIGFVTLVWWIAMTATAIGVAVPNPVDYELFG